MRKNEAPKPKKCVNELNRLFSNEEIQMDNNYLESAQNHQRDTKLF